MIVKHTGNWLRELRILNNLKQKEAAELFKTKRSTYSCWESRYKNKILPEHVLKAPIIRLLIMQSFKAKVRQAREVELPKKKSLFKEILKWIVGYKNL